MHLSDREVVTSSADTVDAYHAATGESLWQLAGLQGNHIPSASVVGDKVFVGSTTMYGGAMNENATAGSNCCIHQETGEQVFAKRIGNPCWASAVGVNRSDAESMMEAREAAEKQRKANAVPADQAAPKSGPEKVFAGMPESQTTTFHLQPDSPAILTSHPASGYTNWCVATDGAVPATAMTALSFTDKPERRYC